MQISSQPIPTSARWTWLIILSVVMVVLDQASKVYAVTNWRGLPPQSYFGDLFRIHYAENHGAFLSMFASFPEAARFWILVVLNGLILVGVAGYILHAKSISRYVFLAFALVVAGGIGNMIDRVRFGYVIDYFNLGIGGLRTGIFNVADMAITAGFFMMIPLIFFGEADANQSAESKTVKSVEPAAGSAPS